MVAAVFHNPLPDTSAPLKRAQMNPTVAIKSEASNADSTRANSVKSMKNTSSLPFDWRGKRDDLLLKIVPPVLGMALLVGIWQLIALGGKGAIPTPLETGIQAVDIFSKPFYSNGPNDQGIGWNIWSSLKRVAVGFGLAALVGIPLGFMIGRFTFLNRMFGPLISLLRPVSPLAWLPIGLLVFKGAHPAAIWTIFICSIWPMIINTAVGVQRVPQDYMNVARVLNLSEWKIITKILFPAVLPYMLTGVRLAVGTAWLLCVRPHVGERPRSLENLTTLSPERLLLMSFAGDERLLEHMRSPIVHASRGTRLLAATLDSRIHSFFHSSID